MWSINKFHIKNKLISPKLSLSLYFRAHELTIDSARLPAPLDAAPSRFPPKSPTEARRRRAHVSSDADASAGLRCVHPRQLQTRYYGNSKLKSSSVWLRRGKVRVKVRGSGHPLPSNLNQLAKAPTSPLAGAH